MLAIWPLISVYLYKTRNVTAATFWTLVGGHMFMPVQTTIDMPMIPPLGKESIPSIFAYIGCRFVSGRKIDFFALPGIGRWLLFVIILGPFITAEQNRDIIFFSGRQMPPMSHYDAISAVINQMIGMLPLFLGWQLFQTAEQHLEMFKNLVWAGLLYSFLMLFEVKMSPQLHVWFYGYFPHSFVQQIRYDGYRPVVFMGHGLLVSFFATIVLLSASVLWQMRVRIKEILSAGLVGYLIIVLLLCKSLASLAYGLVSLLLIKATSTRFQMRVGSFLACFALLYPILSILNLFPHQLLIDWVISFDAERAQSLRFRFDNEGLLLEHAWERFFWGWGKWGRNRVFDTDTGADISVTDGLWIITFGEFGFIGFLATFGLMALSAFKAHSIFSSIEAENEKIMIAAHILMVAIIMIDQLPNASIAPWLWLLIGILLGRAKFIAGIKKKFRI